LVERQTDCEKARANLKSSSLLTLNENFPNDRGWWGKTKKRVKSTMLSSQHVDLFPVTVAIAFFVVRPVVVAFASQQCLQAAIGRTKEVQGKSRDRLVVEHCVECVQKFVLESITMLPYPKKLFVSSKELLYSNPNLFELVVPYLIGVDQVWTFLFG